MLNVDLVHEWISTPGYWAQNRPGTTIEKALARSLNFGLYEAAGGQVAFCRWMTDGATLDWLCDVFVDPAHRGIGLGGVLGRDGGGPPRAA